MSAGVALQESATRQHCKALSLPPIGGQCGRLAEQAAPMTTMNRIEEAVQKLGQTVTDPRFRADVNEVSELARRPSDS